MFLPSSLFSYEGKKKKRRLMGKWPHLSFSLSQHADFFFFFFWSFFSVASHGGVEWRWGWRLPCVLCVCRDEGDGWEKGRKRPLRHWCSMTLFSFFPFSLQKQRGRSCDSRCLTVLPASWSFSPFRNYTLLTWDMTLNTYTVTRALDIIREKKRTQRRRGKCSSLAPTALKSLWASWRVEPKSLFYPSFR